MNTFESLREILGDGNAGLPSPPHEKIQKEESLLRVERLGKERNRWRRGRDAGGSVSSVLNESG